jgi:hypothetical protein
MTPECGPRHTDQIITSRTSVTPTQGQYGWDLGHNEAPERRQVMKGEGSRGKYPS